MALKAIVDIQGKMKNEQMDGQDLPDNWDESAEVIFARIDEVLAYYEINNLK